MQKQAEKESDSETKCRAQVSVHIMNKMLRISKSAALMDGVQWKICKLWGQRWVLVLFLLSKSHLPTVQSWTNLFGFQILEFLICKVTSHCCVEQMREYLWKYLERNVGIIFLELFCMGWTNIYWWVSFSPAPASHIYIYISYMYINIYDIYMIYIYIYDKARRANDI